jgi:putative ubiquitin-RnfH superfamily antitoxin RatB of RatAB toxin-antitoxin module
MDSAETLTVEVAYALPRRQLILELQVVAGSTAEQAIHASGILEQFPGLDLKNSKVGIFGKPCKLTDTLSNGDRVEIYRPLIADPKEIRKQRAAKGKEMKKGAGSQE